MDVRILRHYWRFFSEAWKLFKIHADVRTDEEWDRLIQEATILRNEYPGEFSQKVLMAILEELNRRANGEK